MSDETLKCACRGVRLVGPDAKEKADIGPLKSEVRGLEWASDGHLYIQLDRDILVASADGKTVRMVQEAPEDGTILAMSISPSASHLATSIHTPGDNQVHDLCLLRSTSACACAGRRHMQHVAWQNAALGCPFYMSLQGCWQM